jgi:hypothetical protein
VENGAREQEARVVEHQAEQPDDLAGAGIVGEVYFQANKYTVYSLNSITATKTDDGSVTI